MPIKQLQIVLAEGHIHKVIFPWRKYRNTVPGIVGKLWLDSRPEGSYKIESVSTFGIPSICLFFCLSRCFLGVVSLVFTKLWHSSRNPDETVCDRVEFSRKKKLAPKIAKVGQKWVKIRFFDLLEKFCL